MAGLEPESDFVRACAEEERRIAAGWASFWHYTGLGQYGAQLDYAFSVFPREQVLVLRYRRLVDEPAATLDRICAFLGHPKTCPHGKPIPPGPCCETRAPGTDL